MYIFFLKVFNKFYNLLRLFLELIDINNKKTADTISILILRKEKVTFLKT